MDIDKSWMPTLLCIINDSLKYNDMLRNSETVTDIEDIEEWMMSIYQFKGHIEEIIRTDTETLAKCKKYLEDH